MKRRLLLAFSTTLLTPSLVVRAQSANFPFRNITLVVPFTPSSGSDIIARILAPRLAARWGQSVIVDNKTGASGTIGASLVARAQPDGHTLLVTVDSFTMAPALIKNMPYDPEKSFAPVTRLADSSYALAVHPSVPAKDMNSFFEYAKKNPGRLNYATPGNGTPHHLQIEMIKSRMGIDLLHVPYKGISNALTDLIGGQVQVMLGSLSSLRQYAESGKLRLLAVTGAMRSPFAPEVPTFKEQGLSAVDGGNAYYFVSAPAGTPASTLTRLQQDFAAVVNSPEVKAELTKQSLVVNASNPAELSTTIADDLLRWRKVVKTANITAD